MPFRHPARAVHRALGTIVLSALLLVAQWSWFAHWDEPEAHDHGEACEICIQLDALDLGASRTPGKIPPPFFTTARTAARLADRPVGAPPRPTRHSRAPPATA